jgi:hypothetical protein
MRLHDDDDDDDSTPGGHDASPVAISYEWRSVVAAEAGSDDHKRCAALQLEVEKTKS